jgi:hypothetical protein
MAEELKKEDMQEAMNNFVARISENDGVINGAKYKQDVDLEIQIRINYLEDTFGKEKTENEISKYRDTSGNFVSEIIDERVWNVIVSNLRGENI